MSDPSIKVCPRCDNDYAENSVMSKQIEICWTCHLELCMIEWYEKKDRASEIPGEVMEREMKFQKLQYEDFQTNDKKH